MTQFTKIIVRKHCSMDFCEWQLFLSATLAGFESDCFSFHLHCYK